MKLVYFSWVRERIGREEETVELPDDIATTGQLITWLASRGPEYQHALSDTKALRIALDRVHVHGDTPLAEAREVALFPPMTGG
ncbi:MAG: molybdopterin converting factor subunit 1 [Alphaproteobacteria bacterium]